MTREEILKDKAYIENHIGEIPAEEMLNLYEKYLNGSEGYALGVELDGEVYVIFSKHIPLKYCSCQTDHKTNKQYIRFRPHLWGAKEIANTKGVLNLGKTKDIYSLYPCKNKKGYNSGYCCEIALFNYYGIEGWKQDNKRADKGGDIEINGTQIQIKYVEKNSLATVTNTKKIVNKMNELLKGIA